jgi:hypothetical protein
MQAIRVYTQLAVYSCYLELKFEYATLPITLLIRELPFVQEIIYRDYKSQLLQLGGWT